MLWMVLQIRAEIFEGVFAFVDKQLGLFPASQASRIQGSAQPQMLPPSFAEDLPRPPCVF